MTDVAVAKQDEQPKTINEFIERQSPEFAKALVGSGLTAQKFARVAITTIRSNEKLMNCSAISLIAALMRAAQAGILPDGRRASLIPYKGEATYMLGYIGMIEIAMRDTEIRKIATAVVYEKDEFEYELGLNEKLRHVPCLKADKGEKLFVYAIAFKQDGSSFFEVLDKAAVHRARGSSYGWKQYPDSSPWTTHEDSMWRKTAVRAIFKYLPNVDVADALQGDDMDFIPEATDITPRNNGGGVQGLKDKLIPHEEPPVETADPGNQPAFSKPEDEIKADAEAAFDAAQRVDNETFREKLIALKAHSETPGPLAKVIATELDGNSSEAALKVFYDLVLKKISEWHEKKRKK